MEKKAYLVLENGDVYEGYAFGAEKVSVGELVFTTATTGYLETLTDPSYFGQLVCQTFPLIGNYGVIPSDFEEKTMEIIVTDLIEPYKLDLKKQVKEMLE